MRSATAHSSLKLNGSDGKVSVCNARDPGSIPGLGRSPGEGNGSPLQYSCLENPMDLEPGRLPSMGSQSWTWLRNFTFHRLYVENVLGAKWAIVKETYACLALIEFWGHIVFYISGKNPMCFCLQLSNWVQVLGKTIHPFYIEPLAASCIMLI